MLNNFIDLDFNETDICLISNEKLTENHVTLL